jgi:hypothetical protein
VFLCMRVYICKLVNVCVIIMGSWTDSGKVFSIVNVQV